MIFHLSTISSLLILFSFGVIGVKGFLKKEKKKVLINLSGYKDNHGYHGKCCDVFPKKAQFSVVFFGKSIIVCLIQEKF